MFPVVRSVSLWMGSGWRLLLSSVLHITGMVRSVFGRLAAARNPYGLLRSVVGVSSLDVVARIFMHDLAGTVHVRASGHGGVIREGQGKTPKE